MLIFKKLTPLLFVFLPMMGFAQAQMIDHKTPPVSDAVVSKPMDKTLQAQIYPNTRKPLVMHIGFDNSSGQATTVTLKNEKNTCLYAKRYSRNYNHVTLKLNTADLPNGVYTVIVHNKETKIVKTIEVGTVKVQEEKRLVTLN